MDAVDASPSSGGEPPSYTLLRHPSGAPVSLLHAAAMHSADRCGRRRRGGLPCLPLLPAERTVLLASIPRQVYVVGTAHVSQKVSEAACCCGQQPRCLRRDAIAATARWGIHPLHHLRTILPHHCAGGPRCGFTDPARLTHCGGAGAGPRARAQAAGAGGQPLAGPWAAAALPPTPHPHVCC